MKISVCTDMIFGGMPTEKAAELVKKAGADAIEFWSADGKNIAATASVCKDLGLAVAAFCAPGAPAISNPAGAKKLPDAIKKNAEISNQLGCRKLIVTGGNPEWGVSPAQMNKNMRASIESILPVLEECDLTLMLEPLNASELDYMRSSHQAFELCRIFKSSRLKVLYDIYHMQYMEGNLINTINDNIQFIGHFHAADLPGRTAPGLGEINYRNVLAAIAKTGYEGFVGLEYLPGKEKETELAKVVADFKA